MPVSYRIGGEKVDFQHLPGILSLMEDRKVMPNYIQHFYEQFRSVAKPPDGMAALISLVLNFSEERTLIMTRDKFKWLKPYLLKNLIER